MVGIPASLITLVNAPSPGVEVQTNFDRVESALAESGGSARLEFEPARYRFAKNRILVFSNVGEDHTLIDVIIPSRLESTRIETLRAQNFYSVAYANKVAGPRADFRIKMYDASDGLETAEIVLLCVTNGASPAIEVLNERLDRSTGEFSFDLLSNCKSVFDAEGGEIEFGDSVIARSRVTAKLSDNLVPEQIVSAAGLEFEQAEDERNQRRRERHKNCMDFEARTAKAELGDRSGWVGDCLSYYPADSVHVSSQRHGEILYYSGRYIEAYPAASFRSAMHTCDITKAEGYEIIDDGSNLVRFCPNVVREWVDDAYQPIGQTVKIQYYTGYERSFSFNLACDCFGLEIRGMKVTPEERRFTFELGADHEAIRVNGTPFQLGELPKGQKSGETYAFGQFEVVLTDAGMVQSFNKMEN